MKTLPALFVISSVFVSCASKTERTPLPTVQNLRPEAYTGVWHEVARLPNFFERNVVAARATYGLLPDGAISVFNEGLKADGKETSIRGKATTVGSTPDGEAKLEVRFDQFPASLFAGDYWILDLNDAHAKAIVGSPDRKFLWLLSKDPDSTPADFSDGIRRMESLGFEMDELIVNPRRIETETN